MSDWQGGQDHQRISVSRDALRADLAELELRLRVFIETELYKKADRADMVEALTRIKELEDLRRARDRGELTPALQREVRALARAETEQEASREWTGRERLLAVMSVTTAGAMALLSILLAIHGWSA